VASPTDADAAHLLGMIAYQQRDLHGAHRWMLRSTELAPHKAMFRINLAAVLGDLGRPREAIAQLKVAASLPGGDRPELHNNIGVAHERLGELPEAAEAFKRAIAQNPNYVDAHVHLGNAFRKGARYDDAARSYERALRLNPASPKVWEALGVCHAELGDAAPALRCMRRAVELDPNDPGHRSATLYTLHYDPQADPQALFREHLRWGELHVNASAAKRTYQNDRSPTRKLRIGYVSPTSRNTPRRGSCRARSSTTTGSGSSCTATATWTGRTRSPRSCAGGRSAGGTSWA
jgi:tetratricopeptide (TPR) repeat protein